MRDFHLAIRNMRRLLIRRSRAFGLFVLLAAGFVLVCNGFVGQAGRAVEAQLRESSIMRTVEVSSEGVSQPIALTASRIQQISTIPGVVSAQPWIQSGISVTTSTLEVPGALWATPRMEVGQPPLVAAVRSKILPLADKEVILPARITGVNLRPLLNTTVTIEYTRAVTSQSGEAVFMKALVVGLYDESVGGRDGPAAAYVNLRTAVSMAAAREALTAEAFGRKVGFPKVIVEVAQAADVPRVQRGLSDDGFNASSIQSQLDTVPPAVSMISILGKLMTGLLLVVCLGAGLSIGATLVQSRRPEIGLLKALGFSNGRVAKIFALELTVFGLATGVAGALLGTVGSLVVQQFLQGGELFGVLLASAGAPSPPAQILLVAIAPAVAMSVGSALPVWRVATIPPDHALRDLA